MDSVKRTHSISIIDIGEEMKKYLAFIILWGFIISGCKEGVKEEPSKENKINIQTENTEAAETAPDFVLKSTTGKNIQLSDYRGKIVIVDFWATWCAPCRKGIPDLVDIQKEFKGNVVVIGISLDEDTRPDVVPFMKEYGINYPIVYGNNKVIADYGSINAIPTSFIIDKQGKIVDKHIGIVPKSEYLKKIKEILS